MNVFWWIVLGVFVASSLYVFWWMFRMYKTFRELVQSIRELYQALKTQK
jgi:hypothetical protein